MSYGFFWDNQTDKVLKAAETEYNGAIAGKRIGSYLDAARLYSNIFADPTTTKHAYALSAFWASVAYQVTGLSKERDIAAHALTAVSGETEGNKNAASITAIMQNYGTKILSAGRSQAGKLGFIKGTFKVFSTQEDVILSQQLAQQQGKIQSSLPYQAEQAAKTAAEAIAHQKKMALIRKYGIPIGLGSLVLVYFVWRRKG